MVSSALESPGPKEEEETIITVEIPTLIRVYKNGTIERLKNSPFVTPNLDDPATPVSSKDVLISQNPPISARLFLPKPLHFQSQQSDTNHHTRIPILVYFHGGGFFFESAFSQLHHNYITALVSEAHVLVVSVEYRLAPEAPLPAAYEDCWEALKWVAGNTEPWLIKHGDFNRVFIGGDSAGANIAHNMGLRAGAEELPRGVKVLGASVSHPYFLGVKDDDDGDEGKEQNVGCLAWRLVYPSAPGGLENPLINPMVDGAPDLGGMGCEKLLVCTAGRDELRESAVSYYEAVKKSGWHGEVELFEVEDEGHAFHVDNPHSQNTILMLKRLADFLLS